MQLKQKNTMLASLLMLALAAMITVGGTLAYLTDASTDSVNYVVGNVKISVYEPSWGDNSVTDKEYFEVSGNTVKAYLRAGRYIPKDPTVRVDSGSEDCYVRLKVTIDPDLAKVVEVPKEANGWKREAVRGTANTYYYTYPNVLKSGTSSPAAFEKVLVLSNPKLDPGKKHEDMLAAAKDQKITVIAQAIQADGIDNSARAFEIMDGYFTT